MKTASKLIVAFLIIVIFLVVVVLFLPASIKASKPAIVEPDQLGTSDELTIGAQTAITVIGGSEANLSQHLSGGFSDPKIAASSDYVAAVYRGVNGNVYLQATNNSNGWYGTPVTLGQGTVPELAFQGTNTVHAVWLKSGNEVIEYKKCTLSLTTATCDSTPTTIRGDTNEILNNPVIAVDGSGRLHVAWTVPANDKVESRVHNGSSWGTTASVPGPPDAPEQAAIAAATNKVILAFINNVAGLNSVSVYNSPVSDNPHAWTNRANFSAGSAGGGAYDRVGEIDLAASGTNAFLAWSIRDTDANPDIFKLAGSTTSNSGDSWGAPTYIPSANSYGTNSDADKKLSKDSSTPVQETGLRPSLAVTPTNNFVVVWQERPDDVCQDANPGEGEPELNGTSAIFFADKSSTNWTTQLGQLDNDRTTYSIDPDIVVQGSTRHIIYMKYTGGNPADCAGGGGASQYNIYYRGPFVTVQSPGTPDTYSISGRVTDNAGNLLSGVKIWYQAGIAYVLTNNYGEYTITGLAPGTYSLEPHFDGYEFPPFPRVVTVGPDITGQNFTAVACLPGSGLTVQNQCPAGTPPLLDLPIAYGYNSFGSVLRGNTGPGTGRVNSWFDHSFPTYCNPPNGSGGYDQDGNCIWQNNNLTRWDGTFHSPASQIGVSWYDGHDGIDFSRIDPGDRTSSEYIFAAAPGIVTRSEDDCGPLGHCVEISHSAGYSTVYGHLDEIFVGAGWIYTGSNLKSLPLGTMGNTGKSTGIHLHFGVKLNGQVVDPFGWWGRDDDPWGETVTSRYLWKEPLMTQAPVDSSGGSITSQSNNINLSVSPETIDNTLTFQLLDTPVAGASAELRSTGNSFWISILEWLTTVNTDEVSVAESSFAKPITLTVTYEITPVRHLNISQLAVYHWRENDSSWERFDTIVSSAQRQVTAETIQTGMFDVQAPLLCPADTLEINDDFYNSKRLITDGAPFTMLFDIFEDEDWFWLDATGGFTYTIQTANLATGVDTVIEIYDTDGITPLASDDNGGGGLASKLEWVAPQDGMYYVQVKQAPGSVFGCNASYELMTQVEGNRPVYLPIIVK